LQETEGADRPTKTNPFRFVALPAYQATAEGIQRAMNEYDHARLPFRREAVLFYHTASIYTFGLSPLACYLKSEWLPALLERLATLTHESPAN